MNFDENTRELRFRRGFLRGMNYEDMIEELQEIQSVCGDMEYLGDAEWDRLQNAFDSDTDAARDFQMLFSDLQYDIQEFLERLYESGYGEYFTLREERETTESYEELKANEREIEDKEITFFDNVLVALIGNKWECIGAYWDPNERHETEMVEECNTFLNTALNAARKRLMRMTKKDMIWRIGDVLSVLLKFQDLIYQFKTLKTLFDATQDVNMETLMNIKYMDEAYEQMKAEEYWDRRKRNPKFVETRGAALRFNSIVEKFPLVVWVM